MSQAAVMDPNQEASVTLTMAGWQTVLAGLHELAAKHSLQTIIAINTQLQPQLQPQRVPAYPAPGNHVIETPATEP